MFGNKFKHLMQLRLDPFTLTADILDPLKITMSDLPKQVEERLKTVLKAVEPLRFNIDNWIGNITVMKQKKRFVDEVDKFTIQVDKCIYPEVSHVVWCIIFYKSIEDTWTAYTNSTPRQDLKDIKPFVELPNIIKGHGSKAETIEYLSSDYQYTCSFSIPDK